jgi:Ser/Thr protein kinase RdoA (MazF antagonist)
MPSNELKVHEISVHDAVGSLWPGRAVHGLKRVRAEVKAGKWHCYVYEVRFDGDAVDAPPQVVILTTGDPKYLKKAHGRNYAGLPSLGLLLKDGGVLAEAFPYDWKLPSLPAVTNPEVVRAFLAGAFEQDVPVLSMTPMRYVPHKRFLIRYHLDAAGAGQEYVGKLYASENLAGRVWRTFGALNSQPQTADLLPHPVAFHQEWRLVLMESLPGRPLSATLLEADKHLARDAMASTARLLAALHSVRIPSEKRRDLETDLTRVRGRLVQLPHDARRQGREIAGLIRRIEKRPPALLDEVGYTFVHGDFNPRLVLLDGETARVVDLDSCCSGDPAIDVGKFIGSLRAHAVESGLDGRRRLALRFLAEYEKRSERRVAERALVFTALSLIYRAERVLMIADPSSFDVGEALIAEAKKCLRAARWRRRSPRSKRV